MKRFSLFSTLIAASLLSTSVFATEKVVVVDVVDKTEFTMDSQRKFMPSGDIPYRHDQVDPETNPEQFKKHQEFLSSTDIRQDHGRKLGISLGASSTVTTVPLTKELSGFSIVNQTNNDCGACTTKNVLQIAVTEFIKKNPKLKDEIFSFVPHDSKGNLTLAIRPYYYIARNTDRGDLDTKTDEGATVYDYSETASFGFFDEVDAPYKTTAITEAPTRGSMLRAMKYLKLGKYELYMKPLKDMSDAITYIGKGYPIFFGTEVFKTSFYSDTAKKTGVIPMPSPSDRISMGGHALFLYKYDYSRAPKDATTQMSVFDILKQYEIAKAAISKPVVKEVIPQPVVVVPKRDGRRRSKYQDDSQISSYQNDIEEIMVLHEEKKVLLNKLEALVRGKKIDDLHVPVVKIEESPTKPSIKEPLSEKLGLDQTSTVVTATPYFYGGNSWGTTWGKNGTFQITPEYFTKYTFDWCAVVFKKIGEPE